MGTLLLIPLIVIVIAVVIGAFIIQLATKFVAGFTPAFGTCVATAIVATIAALVLHWLLGSTMGMGGRGIALLAGWLVNALVINLMVKNGGVEMGFGKAMLVSVVEYVIYIVFAVLCFVLIGGAMIGTLGAMHH